MQRDVPLKPRTTFHIGGPADYLQEVVDEDDVREALAEAQRYQLPAVVMAGGSNLLVSDEGVRGYVLQLVPGQFRIQSVLVHAQAGVSLFSLIQETAARGLGGWESLAGIPGSFGGAIRGNAGAFGVEIKDVLRAVRALHRETGEVRTFTPQRCRFEYRTSFFKRNPQWIILDAIVRLTAVEKSVAMEHVERTVAEREKRHLQNVRAAGSFFTNPSVGDVLREQFEHEKGVEARGGRVPAGWLIEKAGMRGVCVGGACMSVQHANYLVNESGEATARDVIALARSVVGKVAACSAVTLDPEVHMLGDLTL